MKNSKLVYYLHSLSQAEMVRFEKYVNSPYFNVHSDTIRLFDVLKKFHPEFPEKKVDGENIYNQIFPRKKYDPNKIHTLNKYLLNLLLDFFAQEEIGNETFLDNELALQRALLNKGLDKFLPKIIQKGAKRLNDHPYRDANFFHEQFRFNELHAEYSIKDSNRSHEITYRQAMESLDHFYLIQKIKYACAIINRNNVLASDDEIQLLDEVISFCTLDIQAKVPLINLYFQLLMMLHKENGDVNFHKVGSILHIHHTLISNDDLTNIYGYLINYCSKRYKEGALAFLNEMFAYYKQMIESNLLFSNPLTASIHYKNVVTLSLKFKEYEWAEEFIKKYKKRIDPSYRDKVYSYNMANLSFHRENYSESMRYLQRATFIDAFDRLNCDILLLKTYYELGDLEPLLSLCTALTTFLRRNKSLSEGNRIAYANFVKIVRKLAKAKYGKTQRSPRIVQDVKEANRLVERDWLQEKLSESF